MSLLARIILGSFHGKYFAVHVLAIVITYVCVVTSFDWNYFVFMSQFMPKYVLFIADISGYLVSIFLPLGLVLYGKRKGIPRLVTHGFAVGYSVLSAFVVSMSYKAFTGRISPPLHGEPFVDVSNQFQFGFLEHSIIGGWPSSHTAVVFAIAACLTILYRSSYRVQILAYSFALFVGVSETIGFHWFSEFLAGALIGTAVGLVTGRTYEDKKVV
jgi:membrane-associated phospholipid phosphatase